MLPDMSICEWQKMAENAKNGQFNVFEKVLPDMSLLIRQKIGGKCQNWKTLMGHFRQFLNTVEKVHEWIIGYWCVQEVFSRVRWVFASEADFLNGKNIWDSYPI